MAVEKVTEEFKEEVEGVEEPEGLPVDVEVEGEETVEEDDTMSYFAKLATAD